MTKQRMMFFALLRMSIFGNRSEDLSVFTNAKTADWDEIFALSTRQGVIQLAYGGLQYLPAEIHPPRKLKLRWCANVIKGNERYDRYQNTVHKLSLLFSQHHIPLLIMKGVSIAQYYPIPHYREGGDIDVYLFNNAEKADTLISSLGINVSHLVPKNSSFIFDEIMIENHRTFFDTELRFKRERELFRKMEIMLTDMLSNGDCPKLGIGEVRKLPEQVAALYMVGHLFRHFCCLDINCRQLCDWTVFFTTIQDRIDNTLFMQQVRELDLEQFVNDINSFCSAYLGFQPTITYSKKINRKAEKCILKILLRYRTSMKINIPTIAPILSIFRRNSLYKQYLKQISISDFLFPELKSYITYVWHRLISSSKPIRH